MAALRLDAIAWSIKLMGVSLQETQGAQKGSLRCRHEATAIEATVRL